MSARALQVQTETSVAADEKDDAAAKGPQARVPASVPTTRLVAHALWHAQGGVTADDDASPPKKQKTDDKMACAESDR